MITLQTSTMIYAILVTGTLVVVARMYDKLAKDYNELIRDYNKLEKKKK